MRKINTGDVFKMGRLLKKSGVMEIVRNAYEEGRKEGADKEKIGLDAILGIVCSCSDISTEGQIYELLGGICEKDPTDVMEQPLEVTIEDISGIFRENNIANFLRSASDLAGKM